MKAYVYKYALSKGIFEIEAEIVDATSGNKMYASETGHKRSRIFTDEYAGDFAAAAVHADRKRLAKIKSLKAQIKKLEALRFDAPVKRK